MTTSQAKEITVLGAGVISLTISLLLRAAGHNVHIYARDLPEDTTSTSFASPWAGANWCTLAQNPTEQQRDAVTFRRWTTLNKTLPEDTMTMMQFEHYFPKREECWFKNVVGDFKEIPAIPGTEYGTSYKSFTISVPNYTLWLVSQLTSPTPTHLEASTSLSLGPPVTFHRTPMIPSLSAGASLHPSSSILINATGLGSGTLSDVRDAAVHPIRGQTLLLSIPPFKGEEGIARCMMKPTNPALYIIPRARSGLVILGGSFEVGSNDTSPNDEMSNRILKGCVELCPQLLWKDVAGTRKFSSWTDLKSSIVGVNVGLRPGREGGARVQKGGKVTNNQGNEVQIVHAYGIAASGYQASFGIAEEVQTLVDQCVDKARL